MTDLDKKVLKVSAFVLPVLIIGLYFLGQFLSDRVSAYNAEKYILEQEEQEVNMPVEVSKQQETTQVEKTPEAPEALQSAAEPDTQPKQPTQAAAAPTPKPAPKPAPRPETKPAPVKETPKPKAPAAATPENGARRTVNGYEEVYVEGFGWIKPTGGECDGVGTLGGTGEVVGY